MSSGQMSENVRCANCDNYQDRWCEKIVDSPHPDMLRDCEHYRVRTQMSSADLISRKAAIDKIHEHMEITKQQVSGEIRDDDVQLYIALHIAEEFIKTIPSAEPQRKKGRWIEDAESFYKAVNEKGGGVDENTPYFTDDIACSECLAKFSVIDNETERFEFCPNCGARMEEKEDET